MTTYKILKIDTTTEKQNDLGGGYSREDVNTITRGYTDNGLFWERANSKYIFIVKEEKRA